MNLADEIQRLQQLHVTGALTDEEFAKAKSAVLAGESFGGQGSGGEAKCYKCGNLQEWSCVLCGKLFCGPHGGERWVWVDSTGGKYGARNTLTKRVICDACTPDPARMKRSVILLVIFFVVVLGFILFGFLFTLSGFLTF